MSLFQIFIDPSTGQYSMSRVCFGLLVVAVIGLVGVDVFTEFDIKDSASLLKTALGITAGVYLGNSTAGAYGRSVAPGSEIKTVPEAKPEAVG